MKRYVMSLTLALIAITTAWTAPQDVVPSSGNYLNMRINQEATARLQGLYKRQQELNSQIESAKSTLGTKVEGATARALEQFNNRQDSICLDLKSQLIDVGLQIDEIVNGKQKPSRQIAQQFLLQPGEPVITYQDTVPDLLEEIWIEGPDGIEYPLFNELSESQILQWIGKYTKKCKKLITKNKGSYTIPKRMKKNDPCLVYLVLTSESMEPDDEKQEWFDRYDQMNDEHRLKLYSVLLIERGKRTLINNKE